MASTRRDGSAPMEIMSNSDGRASRLFCWVKLAIGLSLAGSAGIWGGRAWSEDNDLMYLPGLLSLVCGAILAVSGAQRSVPHRHHWGQQPGSARVAAEGYGGRALPLLGELLVHKHHLLTQEQLEAALEEQREHGGRLGQILISMGLLDRSQLTGALEDQLGYGDPWRETFAGPRAEAEQTVGSTTG